MQATLPTWPGRPRGTQVSRHLGRQAILAGQTPSYQGAMHREKTLVIQSPWNLGHLVARHQLIDRALEHWVPFSQVFKDSRIQGSLCFLNLVNVWRLVCWSLGLKAPVNQGFHVPGVPVDLDTLATGYLVILVAGFLALLSALAPWFSLSLGALVPSRLCPQGTLCYWWLVAIDRGLTKVVA